MSVFTDFDASYGSGCYSGMPTGDGGTDVFHDGSVVNHIHHKIGAAFEDGNFVVRSANQAGGVDTVVDRIRNPMFWAAWTCTMTVISQRQVCLML